MDAKTNIQQFFSGKTIFLTGATGFLGSLLIEKLLRACPDVKRIYVLIRDKWNISSERRFEELFKSPIYNILKTTNIDQLNKVVLLKGNIELEKVGLNEDDWNTIVEEVNCVFHVAASVKFTNPLSQMLLSNVYATNQMLLLAKEIKNLKVFLYTSTAYSQCNKATVEEIFYESSEAPEDVFARSKKLGSIFDEQESIEGFPNNYTYSKYLAEDLLRRKAQSIPLCIVRPTIVSQTWKEPLEGWTDSFLSLPKCMVCYAIGLMHVVPSKPNICFDLIPADYVINNIIAAAWDVGTTWSVAGKNVQIYNCSTCNQNSLTHGLYESYVNKYDALYPSNQKLWMRFVTFSTNTQIQTLFYLLHFPQLFLLDILSFLLGKRRMYVKLYKNMHTRIGVIQHFIVNKWMFKTDNTKRLWNKLCQEDKKLFEFDLDDIDWDAVIHVYIKHLRVYSLKEDPNTLPQALFRSKILKILHYVTIFIIIFVFCYIYKVIFNL